MPHTSILPTSAAKPHTRQEGLCPAGTAQQGHICTSSTCHQASLPVLASRWPGSSRYPFLLQTAALGSRVANPEWCLGAVGGGYLHMNIQPLPL